MASHKIGRALQQGVCQLVYMNEVKFRRFGLGGPGCLGTMDLNGCTGVAIVSSAGAILAHISPRAPYGDPEEATGDAHAIEMMSIMRAHFNSRRTSFGNSETYCVVIYGVFEGEVAMPDQIQIISEELQSWGITPKYVPYAVAWAYQRGPAAGTVLIDGQYEPPAVFVEDVQVA